MSNKTLKDVQKNVENFIETNDREPTYQDFNEDKTLPSARTIQRRFGGIPELRKNLGLKILDHTKGETRTAKANEINKRAKKIEADLYDQMYLKYHDAEEMTMTVTREFAYQQWNPVGGFYHNIRCDVAVTDRIKKHVKLFDFFYPSDWASFGGCVRAKKNKLRKFPVALSSGYTHGVVFVCANADMTQEEIDTAGTQSDEFHTVSLETFKKVYLV